MCEDCGIPYGGPEWVETIVPDEVWWIITPAPPDNKRGGILCIACIARRCKEAGLEDVPAFLSVTKPLRVVATNRALFANDSLSVRWYRIHMYWWSKWWHFKSERMKFIGRIHDSYGDEYD